MEGKSRLWTFVTLAKNTSATPWPNCGFRWGTICSCRRRAPACGDLARRGDRVMGWMALRVPKTSSVLIWWENRLTSATMVALIFLFVNLVASLVISSPFCFLVRACVQMSGSKRL